MTNLISQDLVIWTHLNSATFSGVTSLNGTYLIASLGDLLSNTAKIVSTAPPP